MSLENFLAWLADHGGTLRFRDADEMGTPVRMMRVTLRRGPWEGHCEYAYREHARGAAIGPFLTMRLEEMRQKLERMIAGLGKEPGQTSNLGG